MPQPLKVDYDILSHSVKITGLFVRVSPMQMWIWDDEKDSWYPVDVSDSIEKSMRAYELFFNRTGWRLIQLRHSRLEEWSALLFMEERPLIAGEGSTAAIAICEAIKAASLADAERAKAETEVRG